MQLSQNLNLKLSQKLALSKEMLLSLELIQLPLVELKERIEKEILENPALEIVEKTREKDQNIDYIEDSFSDDVSYFEDSSSANISTGISPTSTNIDLNRRYLEGVISYEKTLYDHLIWQLQVQNLTDKQKDIGITIISLINEDGFLKENLENIFSGEDLNLAKEVLEIIQLFDPPGIATNNVREALLFQLESMKEDNIDKNAYEIIKNHFDLMVARKDNEIAKKLKITINDIKKAFDFLSQLNPYPGREYSSGQTRYIIPDAYVYKRENLLVVEMNEDIIPNLTINKYIEKIARESKNNKVKKEQKKYIIKNIKGAKQFINLVNYRNGSLFKLVLILVKLQEDFFYKGPKFLKPLTMKEAAGEIGLSESTISRLASSKYIQTEWGIHEIKYFFTNSVSKEGKDAGLSSESIREMIKEIFEKEKNNKISDQKIVDILQNKGIKIARRTVAKYRKILNILPSHQRNI